MLNLDGPVDYSVRPVLTVLTADATFGLSTHLFSSQHDRGVASAQKKPRTAETRNTGFPDLAPSTFHDVLDILGSCIGTTVHVRPYYQILQERM